MSKLKSQNHNLNVKSNIKIRTYRFSLSVIKLINDFPNKRVFWVIGDQLLRSATSIGANVIEAKAASSKRDFVRYYEIALKSANETKYWLSLLKDSELAELNKQQVEDLLDEATQLANMLGAALLTMKSKRKF